MKKHKVTHSEQLQICPSCDKACTNMKGLQLHRKRCHRLDDSALLQDSLVAEGEETAHTATLHTEAAEVEKEIEMKMSNVSVERVNKPRKSKIEGEEGIRKDAKGRGKRRSCENESSRVKVENNIKRPVKAKIKSEERKTIMNNKVEVKPKKKSNVGIVEVVAKKGVSSGANASAVEAGGKVEAVQETEETEAAEVEECMPSTA